MPAKFSMTMIGVLLSVAALLAACGSSVEEISPTTTTQSTATSTATAIATPIPTAAVAPTATATPSGGGEGGDGIAIPIQPLPSHSQYRTTGPRTRTLMAASP